MHNQENNYAFIDSNNLNLGIKEIGWKLDFRKFRIYLAEKYKVCLLYTSPSPRDRTRSRMPSSA